jgi:hypothetical protein
MSDIEVHTYPVSLAIREYLLKKDGATPSEFYNMYKDFKSTTSLTAIYKNFYTLKRLNLIYVFKTEKGQGRIPKSYYKVVLDNVNSENWCNPQRALYPKNK